MKKVKIFLSVGLLSLLTACGTTQKTATDAQTTDRGRSNTEVINNNASTKNRTDVNSRSASNTRTTTNTKQSTSSKRETTSRTSSATAATRDTGALDAANMKKMYSDLGMNDAQIRSFESNWKTSMDSWKRSNRTKTMNNFERTENQDRILKEVLDEAQFEKYQQWARANVNID